MKHEYWFHKEVNLLVEKFTKIINSEDLDKFKGALYLELDQSKTMNTLVDVSDGQLFNIQYGQISTLVSNFLQRVGENNKMNVAVYTGNNDKDDYLKISAFSKYESESVKIKTFVELRDAFEWLELNESQIKKIKIQLQRQN